MQIKTWWMPLSLALILMYVIHIHLFLHPDVMYLLHVAKLMLMGGTYSHDFFETNPPLIIFLYMPAWWLANISGISILAIFRLYILLIAFFSLLLCYSLIQQINMHNYLRLALYYSLIIGFLFLPSVEFGQREHLFMLFTFPYLFAVMLRLENKRVGFFTTVVIGLLAGIGIALKPFFLSLPIIIESYYAYKKRSLRALVRLECLVMISMLCLYMVFVSYFFADYFQIILPIVSRLYFIGVACTWWEFFSDLYVMFSFAGLLFFLVVLYSKMPNHCPTINMVLFLALIAFIIAFSIPHAAFYYHVLPAVATAYILFAFLFSQLMANAYGRIVQNVNLKNITLSLMLFGLLLSILILPVSTVTFTYGLAFQSVDDPYARRLCNFFNSNSDNTYMYFSNLDAPILFHYYANAHYVGRYPFFWWEHGLYQANKKEQKKQDALFLVNFISQNLQDKNPHFVLVDTLTVYHRKIKQEDYLAQFITFPAFKKVWMHYHYRNTIGRYQIYERNA